MQGVTVSPPKEFLSVPGEPNFPWIQWKAYWMNYIAAIAGPQLNAERKKNLLLHSLGVEGLRVFQSLPQLEAAEVTLNDDAHTICLKMLDKKFQQKVNIAVNRHKFYTRKQLPTENVEDYVSALRLLSLQCDFTNDITLEELIRDQIIVHSNNPTIQDNLFMAGNPSLQETLIIVKRVEVSLRCVKELKESKSTSKWEEKPTESTVAIVNDKRKKQEKGFERNKENTGVRKPRKCFRCGSLQHIANDKRCLALKEICSRCKATGHFAKFCRTKKEKVALVNCESTSSDSDCNYIGVNNVTSTSSFYKSPKCCLKVNDVKVVMVLDSGSPFSFMSMRVWQELEQKMKFKSTDKLLKPDITPDAFGEFKIKVLGYKRVMVEYKDRITVSKLYIVEKGPTLLGWSDILALKVKMSLRNESLICSVESSLADQVVSRFTKAFEDKLGLLKGFRHDIKEIKGSTPVVQAVRTLPPLWKSGVREEIESLLKANVIEHTNSSRWVSPLVVLQKPNGKFRVCVDLTELNKAIYIDRHPLPAIPEMLYSVKGSKYFTKLDLRQAYHQIKITRRSRELTTFISPFGMFRYKRMPFGLASAAGVFQREMEVLLKEFSNILVFQDDILIHSQDKESHKTLVCQVIKKLEDEGLTMESSKCTFAASGVEYLGHWISGSGVKPKEKLVNCILGTKSPQNKSDLKSFLGMGEYYSRFIHRFAEISHPLRSLLKKNVRFVWSEECENAFVKLKTYIGKFPELNHFQEGLPTILTVDASLKGLGAVLSQLEGGEEKTVSFASRLLSDPETRYSVIERELLACKWAVRKFKNFLWGNRFVMRTDHQPLINVMTVAGKRRASPRIMRLLVGLFGYDFEMEYVPGSRNAVADCLSRFPVGHPDEKDVINEKELVAFLNLEHIHAIGEKEWSIEYKNDQLLQTLENLVREGWPEKKHLDNALKPYYELRQELTIVNNWVCRANRIIPPETLRQRILELSHLGHLGISMTKRRIKQKFWWPGLDASTEKIVKGCHQCNKSDKILKVRAQPMLPIIPPEVPWSMLGIDILGPYTFEGSLPHYILVCVDYYSKWPEYKIVKKIDSEAVIKFLNTIFRREGYPSCIVSDNGPQFQGERIENFAKEKGLSWKHSANYHPETNGLVERMNRVVSESVQLAVANKLDWMETLDHTIWSYRTTPHSVTGLSPFRIMRGRDPGTEFCPRWLEVEKSGSQEGVLDKIMKRQSEYKSSADKKKGARKAVVGIGDFVKIKKPTGSFRKGESKYSQPLKVVEILPNSLRLENGKVWNLARVAKVRSSKTNEQHDEPQPTTSRGAPLWFPHTTPIPPTTETETAGGEEPIQMRRSAREKRKPKKLDSFVTYV